MENIKKISKVCIECEGTGFVSSCCQDTIYDGKCLRCGKFCKKDFCCEGVTEFSEGQEVYIYVGKYSSINLKFLYKGKDSKYLKVKITRILPNNMVEIIYRKKKSLIFVDDIEAEI